MSLILGILVVIATFCFCVLTMPLMAIWDDSGFEEDLSLSDYPELLELAIAFWGLAIAHAIYDTGWMVGAVVRVFKAGYRGEEL